MALEIRVHEAGRYSRHKAEVEQRLVLEKLRYACDVMRKRCDPQAVEYASVQETFPSGKYDVVPYAKLPPPAQSALRKCTVNDLCVFEAIRVLCSSKSTDEDVEEAHRVLPKLRAEATIAHLECRRRMCGSGSA